MSWIAKNNASLACGRIKSYIGWVHLQSFGDSQAPRPQEQPKHPIAVTPFFVDQFLKFKEFKAWPRLCLRGEKSLEFSVVWLNTPAFAKPQRFVRHNT